jgi:hypothetical protein
MATDDTTFLMARPDPMQGLLQLQRRSMSASTLFPPPSSRN